jgi:hypothetical protein
VPALVALAFKSHARGCEISKDIETASQDPDALLAERLRSQTGIFSIGYSPGETRSPIRKLRDLMSHHFAIGHRALDALVGLRAVATIQSVADNPAYPHQLRENFRHACQHMPTTDDQAELAKIAIQGGDCALPAVWCVTDEALLAKIAVEADATLGAAGVRQTAVEKLTDQALLGKLALTAGESVRVFAVERLTDRALLAKIRDCDGSPSGSYLVHKAATERLSEL